jgi:hypothetical protein
VRARSTAATAASNQRRCFDPGPQGRYGLNEIMCTGGSATDQNELLGVTAPSSRINWFAFEALRYVAG